MPLTLYNTLTKKKELFRPLRGRIVGMYNCGPTVYDVAHIGNLRSYIFADTIRRTLEYGGYSVRQVINITDVGHLTDNSDQGEDKIEEAARRQGQRAKEITRHYEDMFRQDLGLLGIKTAGTMFPRASEHIPEQIAMIETLEKKGYTYRTSDGVYFDTSKFRHYGKLGKINLKGLEEGARIGKNAEKKNPTDFALWKFSRPDEKREQEWLAPWGTGYPGWHIECSAMAIKYLGESFDIHTGGIDHIPVHHNNEIAQSEAATGEKYVEMWLHHEFVNIHGGKIGKSLGNIVTLTSLIESDIHPSSYRYFILSAHYRTQLDFTFRAIESAQHTLEKIIVQIALKKDRPTGTRTMTVEEFKEKLIETIHHDLDTPAVIALLHEGLALGGPYALKEAFAAEADAILGLSILNLAEEIAKIPKDIIDLCHLRDMARKREEWNASDALRIRIEEAGYGLYDSAGETTVLKSMALLSKELDKKINKMPL